MLVYARRRTGCDVDARGGGITATPSLFPAESYFTLPLDPARTEFVAKSAGEDEHVLVWGKATGAELDADDEIVDPDFARKAMADWFQTGANVRQMHSPFLPPAGKGIELVQADDGEYVRAKIFDKGAITQVRNGGYGAYSIGLSKIGKVRDFRAPKGRITAGKIVEISLVDRGANPTCKIEVAKALGYRADAPVLFLGGYEEDAVKAAMGASEELDPNAHSGITAHEHTHADGTKHVHGHHHGWGDASHEDSEHKHVAADVIKTHTATSRPHRDTLDHAHEHPNGLKHAHPHDHADESVSHKHAHLDGSIYGKSDGIDEHLKPHTASDAHNHQHQTGDEFVKGGDSHAHPHDHADGEAGHDSHIPDHGTLLPDAQKTVRADLVAEPARTGMRADPATAFAALQPQAASVPGETVPDATKVEVPETTKVEDLDTPPAAGLTEDGARKLLASEVWKKDYSTEERVALAKEGHAIPVKNKDGETVDGGYPIKDAGDLEDAIRSYGRSPDAETKRHITSEAKRLGKTDMLPADWTASTREPGQSLGDAKKDWSAEVIKGLMAELGKDGVAAALGPTTKSLLFQMLQQEITEDGGTGSEAEDIGQLGKSYCALCEFLEDEAEEADMSGIALMTHVPNSLKMLHDLSCAGMDVETLKAVWPEIGRDTAGALAGPRTTLLALLQENLGADRVKGGGDILSRLATLYERVGGLVPAGDPGQAEITLRGAMLNVRKVGNAGELTAYHTAGVPGQPDPIDAGQAKPSDFQRGFLDAGHAANRPQGGPHIPQAGPGLQATDFQRELLTAGHERSSPGNYEGQVKADVPDSTANGTATAAAGRRYYTHAAGDAMTSSLRAIHDNLVALHPDICPAMDDAAKAATSGAFAQAGGGSHDLRPRTAGLPDGATAGAVLKTDEPDASKTVTSDHVKVEIPEDIKAALAMLPGIVADLDATKVALAESQKMVAELARQPDPSLAPFRGVDGMSNVQVVEKGSAVAEAQKRRRNHALYEEAQELDRWLRVGNPDPQGHMAYKLATIKEELGIG